MFLVVKFILEGFGLNIFEWSLVCDDLWSDGDGSDVLWEDEGWGKEWINDWWEEFVCDIGFGW